MGEFARDLTSNQLLILKQAKSKNIDFSSWNSNLWTLNQLRFFNYASEKMDGIKVEMYEKEKSFPTPVGIVRDLRDNRLLFIVFNTQLDNIILIYAPKSKRWIIDQWAFKEDELVKFFNHTNEIKDMIRVKNNIIKGEC